MKVVLSGPSESQEDLLNIPLDCVKTIDTRGMACPYPSFESMKAMNASSNDICLDVLTDSDESALKSIPNICNRRNWRFVVFEDGKNIWRVRIAK